MKVQLIEILDKLMALGGNHDRIALMELRHQFLDFLREEEQLLSSHDDANKMTAINAIHFIDATMRHQVNIVEPDKHLQSYFEHLMAAEKWNYYELRFLIGLLGLVNSMKQALLLANKACELLRDFKAVTRTDDLSIYIAANTISRIVQANFFDEDHGVDLEDELDQWFLKIKILVSENPQLQLYYDIVEIRQAVFRQDRQLIYQLMQAFETNYDEKVVETLEDEINYYIASEKYNRL